MPELEVIRRGRARGRGRGPLLFVHGAYVGAWCWDEHFLPYFAARGFECHAVSLRGHGASEGRAMLPLASLDDYVADVAAVASGLDRLPIIIGHSMGGTIAQRYVATQPALGLVLIASVPPRGLWGTAIELWWRNPSLVADLALVQAGQERWVDLDRLRLALFAPDMPKAKALAYLARMQCESERALLDLSAMHLYARPTALEMPLQVIGGACDGLFGPDAVKMTATWYDTDAAILPGLGHTLMLDPAWRNAADRVFEWITTTYR